MPPAIHPVDLVEVLRSKRLTPAIVFLTSRRACDEAIDGFAYRSTPIPPTRSAAIAQVLKQVATEYPSIADHPLTQTVQQYGVAAHHAGHLPSWKIAIEELMRNGCLDAVFATTTLAAGVDFPARSVVITQSSVRKARDFADLTIGEIQQLGGRGGRRGKDLVGFVVITPSPYIDVHVLARGLTRYPEAIDSQFVVSYPMVLNLLKAHALDHIQPILAKSFAQFQLNKRAETLEEQLDALHVTMQPFGPRECMDWISQWQAFDQAKKRKTQRCSIELQDAPDVKARWPFLTLGRVAGLSKGRGIVLRQYRSKNRRQAMLSVLREQGNIIESPAHIVTQVFDHVVELEEFRRFPWCTPASMDNALHQLQELPRRLRPLPILMEKDDIDPPMLTDVLQEEFPCPTCPSQKACRRDYPQALRLRQEQHRLTKTIQALHSELWHRFHEHIEVLQRFGYLTPTCQLTEDGEWARLIRINHSLLLTELIRMDAFTGIPPSLLVGVLASISHDDDRPGAFPRRSSELGTLLRQVRTLAETLAPDEDPPLLRSDVAALAEYWVNNPAESWAQVIRKTTMAEGDVYRLLARTLEYLSQFRTLKATHPGLADIADQAMALMRRDVLEELP
ncbi:MAG: hypothetical protein GKS05_02800 [Nitrospirales bacterium]|nr:hypothetical protein [Nitrospirales bacterium]